ncbi:MAG: hypothetical protein AB8H86_32095 [Polyangiales bacterium]
MRMIKLLSLCSLLALGCGDDDTPTDVGIADGGSVDSNVQVDAGNDAPEPMDVGVDATSPDAGGTSEFAALVRGTLFTDDLTAAQELHDPLASGGEEAAMALGDFGHDVHLGTTLLGTTENAFAALDRWTNLEGAMMFYGNPAFMEQFGMLFAEPPALELFERAGWHEWGNMDVGDDIEPHYRVIVRGRLRAPAADVQEDHDLVAMGGEAPAMAAGDMAHIVYLGVEDSREFLAFDIWNSDENIEAFYANPDFQAAFGALFESPPVVGVYASTDWHQW